MGYFKDIVEIKKTLRWVLQQIKCLKSNNNLTVTIEDTPETPVTEILPIYLSYALVSVDLNSGDQFRYAQTNLDAVPSPNNSAIGTIT